MASNLLDNTLDKAAVAKELGKGSRKFPRYNSGARALIRVAGKPLAVALSFRWQVMSQGTEVRTIDTNLPWDIAPNQIGITGSLSQLIDPLSSMEAQALYSTVQAMIHQPFVELQVLDYLGTNLFFTRGMFLGLSGDINHGQLSTFSVNFQGVTYQHNVFQEFTPYSPLGDLLESVSSAFSALKSVSGGFL